MLTKLTQGVAELAPNIAATAFRNAPQLELAINLVGFYSAHQLKDPLAMKERLSRRNDLATLEEFLRWVETSAPELPSTARYNQYCDRKTAALMRAGSQRLELQQIQDVLGLGVKPQIVDFNPKERVVVRQRNPPVPNATETDSSAGPIQQVKYPVLDRVLGTSRNTEELRVLRKQLQKRLVVLRKASQYPTRVESNVGIDLGKIEHTDPEVLELLEGIRQLSTPTIASRKEAAVLFLGVRAQAPGDKLLTNPTEVGGINLCLRPGQVYEITGSIGEVVLQTLAEQRRNTGGTTFIRANGKDVNVHMDHDRSRLAYIRCDQRQEYSFFSNNSFDEIKTKLLESGIITTTELSEIKFNPDSQSVQVISADVRKKIALIAAFENDATVLIIDKLFKNTSPDLESQIGQYLAKRVKEREKIIVIRGADVAKGTTDPLESARLDAAIHPYRSMMHAEGLLISYEITPKNRQLQFATPSIAQIIRACEEENPAIIKWDKAAKQRLAENILIGEARMSKGANGELTMNINVVQADIIMEAPDGTKYFLQQAQRTHPDTAEAINTVNVPHSIYANLVPSITPSDLVSSRLGALGITVSDCNIQVSPAIAERPIDYQRPGGEESYPPDLLTNAVYHPISVHVPYDLALLSKRPIYRHASGGETTFSWIQQTT